MTKTPPKAECREEKMPEESSYLEPTQTVAPGLVGNGIPVSPGQDWRDLTVAQRRDYFNKGENSWKSKFTNPGDKLTLTKV